MSEVEEVADNDAGLEGLGSLGDDAGPVGELGDEARGRGLTQKAEVDLNDKYKNRRRIGERRRGYVALEGDGVVHVLHGAETGVRVLEVGAGEALVGGDTLEVELEKKI